MFVYISYHTARYTSCHTSCCMNLCVHNTCSWWAPGTGIHAYSHSRLAMMKGGYWTLPPHLALPRDSVVRRPVARGRRYSRVGVQRRAGGRRANRGSVQWYMPPTPPDTGPTKGTGFKQHTTHTFWCHSAPPAGCRPKLHRCTDYTAVS